MFQIHYLTFTYKNGGIREPQWQKIETRFNRNTGELSGSITQFSTFVALDVVDPMQGCPANEYLTDVGGVESCQSCPPGSESPEKSTAVQNCTCMVCINLGADGACLEKSPRGARLVVPADPDEPAQCECRGDQGFTKDVCSVKDPPHCKACDAGQLFSRSTSTCFECPLNGKCDGTDKLDCLPDFYKTFHEDTLRPSCTACPAGAKCVNSEFIPNIHDSVWENETSAVLGSEGVTIFRIAACPAGFALTRDPRVPQADTCAECPFGSYNLGQSRWGDQWKVGLNQSGTRPPPDGFCFQCPPVGTDCPGGSTVLSQEAYFTHEVDASSQTCGGLCANDKTVEAYACPFGACLGNNTCDGNRTGRLCGYCEEGSALELGVCRLCGEREMQLIGDGGENEIYRDHGTLQSNGDIIWRHGYTSRKISLKTCNDSKCANTAGQGQI